jgi:hypothetical protein
VSQVDKSGEESLVHFAEIIRGKKQTVRILCRELAKSASAVRSDKEARRLRLCVQSSSSGDREPLDPHLVTRQPSDLTGVAWGLNPLKPSESPERYRDIEVSEFGISKSRGQEIG